jgi:hypothetical protein
MARRPNYGFEKRQKELDRLKKKEAKAERKQAKKEERAQMPSDAGESGAPEQDVSPSHDPPPGAA